MKGTQFLLSGTFSTPRGLRFASRLKKRTPPGVGQVFGSSLPTKKKNTFLSNEVILYRLRFAPHELAYKT
uniref:Uncharacterized protein n=1 Tax=Megaselia scalaris TaxID=36166 RepID=T1H1A9_MEGSC